MEHISKPLCAAQRNFEIAIKYKLNGTKRVYEYGIGGNGSGCDFVVEDSKRHTIFFDFGGADKTQKSLTIF